MHRRTAFVLGATTTAALSTAYFYWLRQQGNTPDSIGYMPGAVLVLVALCLAIMASDRNVYGLTSGEIIKCRYQAEHDVPEHFVPTRAALMGASVDVPTELVPARTVPAIAWLKLRDEGGRTGWVMVTGAEADNYPVGLWFSSETGTAE